MYSTGIFKIQKVTIEYTKYNEPIYLIPFGDVHRNAPLCHEKKWLEFLNWAKKKKNAYFLGMGDYQEFSSASSRMKLRSIGLHDSELDIIEKTNRTQTEKLAKELGFMNGRLIGFIEGNHYGEMKNGTTTTQYMAQLLETNYLGTCSFIRLYFHNPQRNTSNSIDIFAHHGKGAARLIGGSLNKVQQMIEGVEADIYLQGHDHKKSVGLITRLHLSQTRDLVLKHKKVLVARTGSFLKGYEDGQSSYVVDAMLSPTDLGVIKIELTPKREARNGDDYSYIDIHASL
jgi:predicted phosphodiesterase